MDSENVSIPEDMTMDSESVTIPEEYVDILEEYVDILVQEFSYDPVRLPLTEDPAQVLYNRRTLETIWDAKLDAINPFTRQPFDINHVIPQSQLRQQMVQSLRLEVIPDYTRILRKREMENLLTELILHYINGNRETERYWKVLWQKVNLETERYAYLSQVVDKRLYLLCDYYYYLREDAKGVCKEVAKIVDVVGFRDSELLLFPKEFLRALVPILSKFATRCDYLKIRSMVLRIYRRMFYVDCKDVFCSCTVEFAFCMLRERENPEISNEDLYNGRENAEIYNEDLYNGMEILWLQNRNTNLFDLECD